MSSVYNTCPICQFALPSEKILQNHANDTFYIDCPKCGKYGCTWEVFMNVLHRLSPDDLIQLCGVLREKSEITSDTRDFAMLTTASLPAFLASAPDLRDVDTKVHKVLRAIARRTTHPGEWVTFPDATSYPLGYAANPHEWLYLIDYAQKQNWLGGARHGEPTDLDIALTPQGWREVQRRPRVESPNGFVAMRFHRSTDEVFATGIKPAVESCGYNCQRNDAVQYNGDIIDKLMAEIRDARFVVADLTGHRRGVYFEAGFAIGQGIEVIWTCHSPRAGRTHFDAEHFNQIRWESPEDLKEKLALRIRATIGIGPVKRLTADE